MLPTAQFDDPDALDRQFRLLRVPDARSPISREDDIVALARQTYEAGCKPVYNCGHYCAGAATTCLKIAASRAAGYGTSHPAGAARHLGLSSEFSLGLTYGWEDL